MNSATVILWGWKVLLPIRILSLGQDCAALLCPVTFRIKWDDGNPSVHQLTSDLSYCCHSGWCDGSLLYQMLSWGPCAPSVSWGKNLSLICRLSLLVTHANLCFSSLIKFDKRFIFFISKNLFFSYFVILPLGVKPSSKAINHRSRWSGVGYTCLVGPSQRALTVAPPLTLPGLPAYGRWALCYHGSHFSDRDISFFCFAFPFFFLLFPLYECCPPSLLPSALPPWGPSYSVSSVRVAPVYYVPPSRWR